MTHVEIRSGHPRGGHSFVVDGMDLSKHVLMDGFTVQFEELHAVIRCTIAATTLDVDLPDAMLDAVRQEAS